MSHTTTGEWKSFEVRMRRRRAERLVAKADAAAEAGRAEDARACLAEARRLEPGIAGLAAVEAKLDARAVPAAATGRVWPAAVAMLAVLTLGGWLLRPHMVAPAHDYRTLRLPAPAVSDRAAAVSASMSTTPAPAVVPAVAVAQPDMIVEPTSVRSVAPPVRPPAPAAGLPANAMVGMPVPRSAAPPAAPADPGPAAAGTPIPVDGEVAAVAAAVDSLPMPAPAPPPTTAPAPRADVGVRTVLDRYAAAYSALDADAAGRVWPRVNRAALSRAFSSLASQQISLGECRIDVTGAAARATCAGTATWTPKIGDTDARTEARRWTFELARAAGDWQIVNARVQNR